MTTTLLPGIGATTRPPRSSGVVTGRLSDIWAMTRRNLVHISREPMQLSDVTIQPLLFTFLFRVFVRGRHPGSRR